jgi:serine/threonine protein phosphatase PrpC
MISCPICDTVATVQDRFCEACGAVLDAKAQLRVEDPPTRPTGGERRRNCRCPPNDADPDENGFCRACGFRMPAQKPDEPSVEMAIDINLAAISDRGRRYRRGNMSNQDAALAARLPDSTAVLAVADGVSSSNGAGRAAATALTALYYVLQSSDESEPPATSMRRAIAAAQAAVVNVKVAHPDPNKDPPETTIVAALVRDGTATIGWVGDSRAYLVVGKNGKMLTRDDSWLAETVLAGTMTLEKAQADRRAHSITQCLGMTDGEIVIHIEQVAVKPGSWLVLCTDGLWNYLSEGPRLAGAIAELPAETDAMTRCRRLALIADESGGHDNISVAMLKIVSVEARPGAIWRKRHQAPAKPR